MELIINENFEFEPFEPDGEKFLESCNALYKEAKIFGKGGMISKIWKFIKRIIDWIVIKLRKFWNWITGGNSNAAKGKSPNLILDNIGVAPKKVNRGGGGGGGRKVNNNAAPASKPVKQVSFRRSMGSNKIETVNVKRVISGVLMKFNRGIGLQFSANNRATSGQYKNREGADKDKAVRLENVRDMNMSGIAILVNSKGSVFDKIMELFSLLKNKKWSKLKPMIFL